MSNHLLHMAAGALYIISGRIISTRSERWRSLSIQITFLFWILGSISWRDWIILSNDIFLLAMHGQESFLFLHQRHAQDPSSPVIMWLCVTQYAVNGHTCVRFVCSGMVTCGVWYKLVCTLCVWVVYYVWFVLCSRVCIWLVCVSDVWWWYVLCGKVCVWLACVSDVLCVCLGWLPVSNCICPYFSVTRTRFMTHSDPVGPVTIKVTLVTRTRSNDSDRIR